VSPKRLYDSYVEDLANMSEKQGYKVIIEGGIPKNRGKKMGRTKYLRFERRTWAFNP